MNVLRLTVWLTLLISLNAHGQLDSLNEFLAGKRSIFTSMGIPKAKGVEISFEYPASWAGEEGKRPNVVYQVTSERGRGRELCNLLINDLPVPAGQALTERNIVELFDPAGLKDFVPPGARFIAGARTNIDGQPAAWVHYTQVVNSAGLVAKMAWISFPIYYDKKLMSLNCAVGRGGDATDAELERLYKKYLPLFQQVANSVVIQSKWKRRP